MTTINLEARLVAVSASEVRAGLRMGLEAVIRRPMPSGGFGQSNIPSEQPTSMQSPSQGNSIGS